MDLESSHIFPISADEKALNQDRLTLNGKFVRLYDSENSIKGNKFDFIIINKLIETLNNELRDKLRHPQWKHFKHMQLGDADRARITNIIWRSWHLKFQHCFAESSKSIPFLDFSIPDLDTTHNQSRSIVLEGQYWCRKDRRVAQEYANWRQEFMKRFKKSRLLSKETSNSNSEKKEDEYCSSKSKVPSKLDFPMFTQNEIDSLIMLDKHDTLFTSNPLHYYPNNYMSDLDFAHQDGMSHYCRDQNSCNFMQPTLDHLNPFYQGYYANISNSDQFGSAPPNHLPIPNSIFSNSVPIVTPNCEIVHLQESPIKISSSDPSLSLNDKLNYPTYSDTILSLGYNEIEPQSDCLRNDWCHGIKSERNKYHDIALKSYKEDLFINIPSPKEISSFSSNNSFISLENCNNPVIKTGESTVNNQFTSGIGPEMLHFIESLQLRIQNLEELVAQQQTLLKPLLDQSHQHLSSSTINTIPDSTKSIPPPKRIYVESVNSPHKRDANSQSTIDSPSSSQTFIPISNSLSPIHSKYSSDYKRRSGIKVLLKKLESILPKRNIETGKISNASLLIRAAEYVDSLNSQVKDLERNFDDVQQKLTLYKLKSSELTKGLSVKGITLPSIMCLDSNKANFEDYVKERSLKDPKFFIFSTIMRPIFEDFNTTYFPNSEVEFKNTLTEFLSKSFSLPKLRTELSNTLCQLCRDTQFLNYPEMLETDIKKFYKI